MYPLAGHIYYRIASAAERSDLMYFGEAVSWCDCPSYGTETAH